MPKLTRKHLFIVLGVIAALALAYFAFFREAPVSVQTGEAARGELMETIDAEGTTRYHDRYVVTAPVSGKMSRVGIHEGANIPQGFQITRVDPSPPKTTDPSQLEEPSVLPAAFPVLAPVSGRVTRVFETGEKILEAGTPIIEISKPSRLELVIDVLSRDATRIKPNMKVIVEDWGADKEPLRARVATVEPRAFTKVSALGVEEQRVNIICELIEPPRELGGNFRVDARIVLWEGKDVLQVPSNALFRSGEDWAVFAVERGRAALRKIRTGHRSRDSVEVLEGLAEGETVILHPPNTVSDGTKVSD
ncbi:MAG: HlyD family efflux transporter periplasmic adaptor subunit [Acidobacteriota bacterium]|nr:MAG: HlyD family efflux transporter periplasmic adaptor subunit [Acidobacteriota bacterium]